jgi:hypothetical protein
MRKLSLLVIPFSLSALVACGGDDGDGVTPIDAPIDTTGGVTCSVSTADFGNKGALTGIAQIAVSTMNPALYRIAMQAQLEAAEPTDVIFVDFFTGYTPFGTQQAPTAVVPGTYQLSGEQLDFATCGVCVTLGTNATASGVEDDYMVTQGTLTVDAVGDAVNETLTFSLSGLQFQHVTINPDTAVTTPVGDGCTTEISNATFTGTVMMAQKPNAATVAIPVSRKFRR